MLPYHLRPLPINPAGHRLGIFQHWRFFKTLRRYSTVRHVRQRLCDIIILYLLTQIRSTLSNKPRHYAHYSLNGLWYFFVPDIMVEKRER